MTTTPRKFDSEIKITNLGEWFYRGQEITLDNVLSYFKKCIREDELGIYIRNTYAELEEHGYVQAETIFLNIIDINLKDGIPYLETENDSILPIKDFLFYSDSDEKIFCTRKLDKFIKYRFNRQSHSFIANLMNEDNGNYFLEINEEKLPIIPLVKDFEVSVPEIYKKKDS